MVMATHHPERGASDRWLTAVAAVLVQVSLGGAYAWSVFRVPLSDAFGWSISAVAAIFSLFILVAGFASVIGGLWLQRSGPRPVLVTSGLLYGGGIALAGGTGGHLWLLYLSYGVLGGAGLGLGYVVPIAVLQRWFPDHRGLINGIAVSGIPAGALLALPIAERLIARVGVLDAFIVLGVSYAVIVTGAGSLVREAPPPSPLEPGAASGGGSHDLKAALRTWQWWVLWASFLLSVSAGVGVISELAPMAREAGGVGATAAAGIVSAAFVGDAAGRLLWPWGSDKVGCRTVLVLIFVVQAATLVALTSTSSSLAFVLLAGLVLFNYGGSSGTMAPFVSELFGPSHVGSIYGLMLTAWGVGGVVGPILIAATRQASGSYSDALWILAAVMAAAALLPFSLRRPRPVRAAPE